MNYDFLKNLSCEEVLAYERKLSSASCDLTESDKQEILQLIPLAKKAEHAADFINYAYGNIYEVVCKNGNTFLRIKKDVNSNGISIITITYFGDATRKEIICDPENIYREYFAHYMTSNYKIEDGEEYRKLKWSDFLLFDNFVKQSEKLHRIRFQF